MAGKLIKRKELNAWVNEFILHSSEIEVDDHVDYYLYSTVPSSKWEIGTWSIYLHLINYIRKKSININVAILFHIRILCRENDYPLDKVENFRIDSIVPPTIFLYRGEFENHLFKDSVFSKTLSKKYGMKACLHRFCDDEKGVCDLYLWDSYTDD